MIRLARFGARKQPYYRVVVIDKERARNGRAVEIVGTYNRVPPQPALISSAIALITGSQRVRSCLTALMSC